MPNNVGFRVVGMYFGATDSITGEVRVDVPLPNPTVQQVMIAVGNKVRAGDVPGVDRFTFFPYTSTPASDLSSIAIGYTRGPKGSLPAGNYFLQDQLGTNPERVWQYYHFSSDFVQKNRNNTFVPFTNPPENRIEDNDIIIWRQVAILTAPTPSRRVEANAAKAFAAMASEA